MCCQYGVGVISVPESKLRCRDESRSFVWNLSFRGELFVHFTCFATSRHYQGSPIFKKPIEHIHVRMCDNDTIYVHNDHTTLENCCGVQLHGDGHPGQRLATLADE